ncbi:MAG: phage resistance protein, partial [Planctomyces sp.]
LLKTVATSHADVISHRGGNFVRFDAGLSIISQHAAGLGYDGLILFLDELILWLAMNSADLGFVKREAAKLTTLVEAQSAGRPIPLISFVARQRDLRELVGDHVPGAERLSFSDSLDWQQGRFDTITLEDRNLPAIA